ncbi:hypothetical protein V3C99_017584 [Haemonchus contortus]
MEILSRVNTTPESMSHNETGMTTFERLYWTTRSIVASTAFLLNLVMFTILIRSTLLTKSFYSLMLIFNIVTVAFQSVIFVDVIVRHTSSDKQEVRLVGILASYVELVSWYFTSALVFVIGLNRLAILAKGPIHSLFAGRKNVLWLSLMLFCFSALVGIISGGLLAGLRELFSSEPASNFTIEITEICSRVNYFFTALPVCSCLFYIVAFNKVRSVRRSSIFFTIADKAENSILKQGFLICIFYMIPEVMLLISQFGFQLYAGFYSLFQLIFDVVINLPPIGFPIIVFICSKELRKLFRLNGFKQFLHVHPTNPLAQQQTFAIAARKLE